MPGLDLRGGKPQNLVLGRGRILLTGDVFRSTNLDTGEPVFNTQRVWRDVGNVTAFTVSQESETKEHRSSLTGIQTIDLEVPVSQKMTISYTADELNALNIARFLSGRYLGFDNDTGSTPLANASAVASDDAAISAGDRNFFVDTAANDHVHDVWYDIVLDMAGYVLTNVSAIDFEDQAHQPIEVWKNPTSRTDTTGGTQLTEGTHYEIDRKMGMIRFYNVAGGLARNDSFVVIWDAPSVDKSASVLPGLDDSLYVIEPQIVSGVSVGLRFILENANNSDDVMAYEFWKVKLKPDGELAGIGDDWAQLSFTGAVESVADLPLAYGSKYGRVIGRTDYFPYD